MSDTPATINISLFLAIAITTLGSSMNFGYNIAVLNNLEERVKCVGFNNCSANKGTTVMYSSLTASYIIFGTVGAFSSGSISDYFGRKKGLILNNIVGIIGGMIPPLVYFMPHIAIIFVSRLILGFNAGLTTGIAPTFLAEISPTKVRGGVTAFHQLLITFGILLSYILTMDQALNTDRSWLISLAFPSIPSVISFVLLQFLPESPRYLYINANEHDKAVYAMECYNELDDPLVQLEELKKEEEMKRLDKKFRVIDLFKGQMYRRAIMLTILLNIMQQFSGINAIISYSSIMFRVAKVPKDYNQFCVGAIGLLNFLSTLPAIYLLEKLGRKTILIVSSVISGTSLLACFVTIALLPKIGRSFEYPSSVASVAFIALFIFGFAIGLGPIPGIATAEIFTQAPRAAAYSIGLGIQWVSSFIILLLYPILDNLLPQGYIFLIFFMIIVPCLIHVIIFMPETKNRPFHEIAQSLAGPKVADAEI